MVVWSWLIAGCDGRGWNQVKNTLNYSDLMEKPQRVLQRQFGVFEVGWWEAEVVWMLDVMLLVKGRFRKWSCLKILWRGSGVAGAVRQGTEALGCTYPKRQHCRFWSLLTIIFVELERWVYKCLLSRELTWVKLGYSWKKVYRYYGPLVPSRRAATSLRPRIISQLCSGTHELPMAASSEFRRRVTLG